MKLWPRSITKSLLSIRKAEILHITVNWMELEDFMLKKASQKEEDKYWMLSLICGMWNNMTRKWKV